MAIVTNVATTTIKTLCISRGPPCCLFGNGQKQGNEHHRGDQKQLAAEEQQTHRGGCHADDGGAVVFIAEPLLHEHSNEQRSQNKLHTLKADGQGAAGNVADDAAGDPVAVVEKRDQKAVPVAADALRRLILGYQRIGFVGKGKDHIGLFPAGIFVGVDERNAVKDVPGVDQQGGNGGADEGCVGGQKAYRQVLPGACEHKQAHKKGPTDAVAAFA